MKKKTNNNKKLENQKHITIKVAESSSNNATKLNGLTIYSNKALPRKLVTTAKQHIIGILGERAHIL